MKISTKGRYALGALLYMAVSSPEVPVTIGRIAENTKLPEGYLEQLFFILRKKGILSTVRGAKGGYRLAQAPDRLLAGDIVRAVEGELVPVPCVGENGTCSSHARELCVTRGLWAQVGGAVDHVLDYVLDYVTLKDLKDSFIRQSDGKAGEIT